MDIDGVVMGLITSQGDHTHLQWVCPDCRSPGFASSEQSPLRIKCATAARRFLVVGVPTQSDARSAASYSRTGYRHV